MSAQEGQAQRVRYRREECLLLAALAYGLDGAPRARGPVPALVDAALVPGAEDGRGGVYHLLPSEQSQSLDGGGPATATTATTTRPLGAPRGGCRIRTRRSPHRGRSGRRWAAAGRMMPGRRRHRRSRPTTSAKKIDRGIGDSPRTTPSPILSRHRMPSPARRGTGTARRGRPGSIWTPSAGIRPDAGGGII